MDKAGNKERVYEDLQKLYTFVGEQLSNNSIYSSESAAKAAMDNSWKYHALKTLERFDDELSSLKNQMFSFKDDFAVLKDSMLSDIKSCSADKNEAMRQSEIRLTKSIDSIFDKLDAIQNIKDEIRSDIRVDIDSIRAELKGETDYLTSRINNVQTSLMKDISTAKDDINKEYGPVKERVSNLWAKVSLILMAGGGIIGFLVWFFRLAIKEFFI